MIALAALDWGKCWGGGATTEPTGKVGSVVIGGCVMVFANGHRFGSLCILAFGAVLLALAFLGYRSFGPAAQAAGSAPDSMTVDMDVMGNTAAGLPVGHTEVLGAVDTCAATTAGGSVTFDVTVQNIPVANAMISFAFSLLYDNTNLSVTVADIGFMIKANSGSSPLSVGDEGFLPDTDGTYATAVADTAASSAARESGSGVLERLTVAVAGGAPNGL